MVMDSHEESWNLVLCLNLRTWSAVCLTKGFQLTNTSIYFSDLLDLTGRLAWL